MYSVLIYTNGSQIICVFCVHNCKLTIANIAMVQAALRSFKTNYKEIMQTLFS